MGLNKLMLKGHDECAELQSILDAIELHVLGRQWMDAFAEIGELEQLAERLTKLAGRLQAEIVKIKREVETNGLYCGKRFCE